MTYTDAIVIDANYLPLEVIKKCFHFATVDAQTLSVSI